MSNKFIFYFQSLYEDCLRRQQDSVQNLVTKSVQQFVIPKYTLCLLIIFTKWNRNYGTSNKSYQDTMIDYMDKLQEKHAECSIQFSLPIRFTYHPFYGSPAFDVCIDFYSIIATTCRYLHIQNGKILVDSIAFHKLCYIYAQIIIVILSLRILIVPKYH